jgi:hypothetical protein
MDAETLAQSLAAAHANGSIRVPLVEVERRLALCRPCEDFPNCAGACGWFSALIGLTLAVTDCRLQNRISCPTWEQPDPQALTGIG